MDGILDTKLSGMGSYAIIITSAAIGTAAGVKMADYTTDKKFEELEARMAQLEK